MIAEKKKTKLCACLFYRLCGDSSEFADWGDKTNIHNLYVILKSIKSFPVNYSYI